MRLLRLLLLSVEQEGIESEICANHEKHVCLKRQGEESAIESEQENEISSSSPEKWQQLKRRMRRKRKKSLHSFSQLIVCQCVPCREAKQIENETEKRPKKQSDGEPTFLALLRACC